MSETVQGRNAEEKESERSSNISTKFDQNPTHSKPDIGLKSGTDRQTHTQIKFVGVYSLQTVKIIISMLSLQTL